MQLSLSHVFHAIDSIILNLSLIQLQYHLINFKTANFQTLAQSYDARGIHIVSNFVTPNSHAVRSTGISCSKHFPQQSRLHFAVTVTSLDVYENHSLRWFLVWLDVA